MQVKVLSGISGSGKSTYAAKLILEHVGQSDLIGKVTMDHLLARFPSDNCNPVAYCSADKYFMGNWGEYEFDASKLSLAHNSCMLEFVGSVMAKKELVIVDNTNLSEIEIAPYMAVAEAFGYDSEVVTFDLGYGIENKIDAFPILARRNSHGVSLEEILRQYNRFQKRRMMPWWRESRVTVQGL